MHCAVQKNDRSFCPSLPAVTCVPAVVNSYSNIFFSEMALQVMDPSDILKQEEEIISLQKSLQEEVALRKEDPRPAPHPAHHVEEVLHLVPGPVTQGRVEVTVNSRCFRRF